MKITIDLNDPENQKQLTRAIEAKLNEITAGMITEKVDAILETKLERLDDSAIKLLLEAKFEKIVNKVLDDRQQYGGPTKVDKLIESVGYDLIRKILSRKFNPGDPIV